MQRCSLHFSAPFGSDLVLECFSEDSAKTPRKVAFGLFEMLKCNSRPLSTPDPFPWEGSYPFASSAASSLRYRDSAPHRATLAGHQGVDCRRSALAMQPARSSSGSCDHDSPPTCDDSIPDEEPNLTWFNQPRQPQAHEFEDVDQSPTWQPKEVALDDGRVLVLDGQ